MTIRVTFYTLEEIDNIMIKSYYGANLVSKVLPNEIAGLAHRCQS